MDTFFHNTSRPDKGLTYWGITLIPPASFYIFKMILLAKGKGIYLKLIKIIEKAAKENKYIIHYGI